MDYDYIVLMFVCYFAIWNYTSLTITQIHLSREFWTEEQIDSITGLHEEAMIIVLNAA